MFGHDDKQNQNDNQTSQDAGQVAPVPDAALDEIAATGDTTDSPVTDAAQTGAPSVTTDDSTATSVDDTPPAADNNGLLDIKRQALQQLSPLVGHLDQTAEEKFKTTMMMIQAADDKSLVQTAYDAAQQITDEKTRAQALLDVINEINYFTHPQDKETA